MKRLIRVIRAMLPPLLLLLGGLAALYFLLQGSWQLDLRLPFLLWLGLLPLSGGVSSGYAFPGHYLRAAFLTGGLWILLAASFLLGYAVALPWSALLIVAVAALLLALLGGWLGAGFSVALAGLRQAAATKREREILRDAHNRASSD